MEGTRICIAGMDSIAVNAGDYILNKLGWEKDNLWVLPSSVDLGQDTWRLSLKKWANTRGVSVVKLEDIYTEKELIFISLHFDKIIDPNKFLTKNLFNIHFSLLPAYRGCFTSIHPILKGENQSGVTLHCIDGGIDTGAIISQGVLHIGINDTARDLYQKYLDNGFNLFTHTINDLIIGTYATHHQPYLNSSYYSRSSIDFSNIKIDLKKTSFEIHNQIRAFIFPEYQLPKINGREVSKSLLTDRMMKPNSIEEDENGYILRVSGVDGYQIILRVGGRYD